MKYVVYHHHGDDNCYVDILPSPTTTPPADAWPLPLPLNGHPECYLDEGSHEWWPWPCTNDDCHDCFGSDPHDGKGPNVYPASVVNVGEQFAPMPGAEPAIFLLFNGLWGYQVGDPPLPWGHVTPPDPPPFQQSPGFQYSPLLVCHVRYDANGKAPCETNDSVYPCGLGSRYYPYRMFSDGTSAVASRVAALRMPGRVLVAPGTYPGFVTIDQAMTIEVDGVGTVTIGR